MLQQATVAFSNSEFSITCSEPMPFLKIFGPYLEEQGSKVIRVMEMKALSVPQQT